MDITLNELEQAINYWRTVKPSTGEERALSPEVNALANVYAAMIFNRLKTTPVDALQAQCQQLITTWRTTVPIVG
jgi:hypothetical protein